MSEQNKQFHNTQNIALNSNSFSPASFSFLKDNPELIFIYKKTEKLLSAIYLVSGLLTDKEPLKWELRAQAVKLPSQAILSDNAPALSVIANILSLLETAHLAGLISTMNFNILRKEFEDLIQLVESAQKKLSTGATIFPNHFFEIAKEELQNQISNREENSNYISPVYSKGHSPMSDRMSFIKQAQNDKNEGEKIHRTLSADISSNRQSIILDMLKKNGELGIKDFSKAIAGCSEKTVQRLLMSLISKGQIKRIGEKRWSKYSLK